MNSTERETIHNSPVPYGPRRNPQSISPLILFPHSGNGTPPALAGHEGQSP